MRKKDVGAGLEKLGEIVQRAHFEGVGRVAAEGGFEDALRARVQQHGWGRHCDAPHGRQRCLLQLFRTCAAITTSILVKTLLKPSALSVRTAASGNMNKTVGSKVNCEKRLCGPCRT